MNLAQFGMVCATQLGDLAALGRRLGFDDFISKWDPFNVDIPVGQQAPDEMVARTVIAVMGAVYLDSKENMGEVALKYVMSRLGVDKHPLLKSELAED
ncbi:hypothetical protein BDV95DRAFT_567218 [Massariosphaeria phaeospora]|uniref:RNase III domain-containing protein n=1 Tax=Massariosphaeria phaeospora TaxID=100035 RepID=A0A7C8I8S9_9PLEO|nr:hypothetical protein BDV95DRAFT_567218 [Massariosphaeria phaeospora]